MFQQPTTPLLASGLLTAGSVLLSAWYVTVSPGHLSSHGLYTTKQCSDGTCALILMTCTNANYCLVLSAFRLSVILALIAIPFATYTSYLSISLLQMRHFAKSMRTSALQYLFAIITVTATLQTSGVVLFSVFRFLAARDYFDDFRSFEGRFGGSFWMLVLAAGLSFMALADLLRMMEDLRFGAGEHGMSLHSSGESSTLFNDVYERPYAGEEESFYNAVPVGVTDKGSRHPFNNESLIREFICKVIMKKHTDIASSTNMSRTPYTAHYPQPASRISRQDSVLIVQNVKPKPKLPVYYNNEFRPAAHSAYPIQQQQQESPEEAQLKSTLARVYNETPTSAKADLYKGVKLPRPTNGRIQLMKKDIPLVICILLVLVSFLLTVVATVLPDWFVIDVPGYSANYGVLKASFHCKPSMASFNTSMPSSNATSSNTIGQFCQSGSYACINASMCKPLISFQVFTIGACAITAVLSVATLTMLIFTRFDTRTIKRIRIATLALVFLAFTFQLLSLAFFVVFKNRAVASINTTGVSGLFFAGEMLSPKMQTLSIPNSAFGSFGSSLVLMAVASVLSAVAFGLYGILLLKLVKE
ncbi:hypothetical protein HDU81_004618 [Chytriomyces hyalinus]|nr:hypothetical protein HDU81_004618 [Chytriomyces hyalinus]